MRRAQTPVPDEALSRRTTKISELTYTPRGRLRRDGFDNLARSSAALMKESEPAHPRLVRTAARLPVDPCDGRERAQDRALLPAAPVGELIAGHVEPALRLRQHRAHGSANAGSPSSAQPMRANSIWSQPIATPCSTYLE